MPDSQIYSVFLLKKNSIEDAVFLFKFTQDPNMRPQLGDSLTHPKSLEHYKIMRDEFVPPNPDIVTHNYYVTPGNNPNRISSYTTNKFDDDQTLKQLFR